MSNFRKIYNKVVFNMDTFDIIEEDSFMYSGPMALCEGEGAGEGEGEGEGAGGNEFIPSTLGDLLPEDMRGDNSPGSLRDFTTVALPGADADPETIKTFHVKLGSLLKSHADTKSMVGGMIKMPGKDAPPEEISAFYKKLGVPEKPEDYKITIPEYGEGEKRALFSDELMSDFAQKAIEKRFTPEQLQFAVDYQADMIKQQLAEMDTAADEGTVVLDKKWGDKKTENMALCELFLNNKFPEPIRDLIKLSGIGNNADFVLSIYDIAKDYREAGTLKGLGDGVDNSTVDAIQNEINTIMNSKEYQSHDRVAYQKVSDLVKKKQQLLGIYKENVQGSKGAID